MKTQRERGKFTNRIVQNVGQISKNFAVVVLSNSYGKSMDSSGVGKIFSRRTRATCQKHAKACGKGRGKVQVFRQINSVVRSDAGTSFCNQLLIHFPSFFFKLIHLYAARRNTSQSYCEREARSMPPAALRLLVC